MDNVVRIKEMREAVKQGNLEKIMELIGQDKQILYHITPFGSWLHIASSHGQFEIAKYLVDVGIDVNYKGGTFHAGAINRAASEGHLNIVQLLFDAGAEMDTSEPDKNPLFAAIYGGHKDIVRFLLERGIDASVRYTGENMKNMDAYDFAIERGQKEIAEMFKPNRK